MTHDSLARFDRVRALRFDAQGLALLDQRALPSSSLWLPMASADDVIDAIRKVKTGSSGFHQDVPKEDVIIERAEVV